MKLLITLIVALLSLSFVNGLKVAKGLTQSSYKDFCIIRDYQRKLFFDFTTPGRNTYKVDYDANTQYVFRLCGHALPECSTQSCLLASYSNFEFSKMRRTVGHFSTGKVNVVSSERVDFIFTVFGNEHYKMMDDMEDSYDEIEKYQPSVSQTILLCNPNKTSTTFEDIKCKFTTTLYLCQIETSYACSNIDSIKEIASESKQQVCQRINQCKGKGVCDEGGNCKCNTPSYNHCSKPYQLQTSELTNDNTIVLKGDFGTNSRDVIITVNGERCIYYHFTEHTIFCKIQQQPQQQEHQDVPLTLSLSINDYNVHTSL